MPGVGVADGVAVALGVNVGVTVGEGVDVGVIEVAGSCVPVGVAEAEGIWVSVDVGEFVGVGDSAWVEVGWGVWVFLAGSGVAVAEIGVVSVAESLYTQLDVTFCGF